MLSRHHSCDPSRELVEQVAQRLATKAVRDTDLKDASALVGDEYVAIVQDGENRKIQIDTLLSSIDAASIRVGTTEYWNSQVGYIPSSGVIIVYSDYGSTVIDGKTVPVAGIKIGSGNAYVQDLAFIGDDVKAALLNHIADNSVHITPEERAFWNNKLNVTDYHEVVEESLIFHRN